MKNNINLKKNKKYCFCFNDPSKYREAIYKLMDDYFICDWYFDEMNSTLKSFDVSQLNSVFELKRFNLGPFYWVRGLIPLLWRDYDVYLMRGATGNLSSFFFSLLKKLFFPNKKVYFWTHGFYGKENWVEKTLWKKPMFKLADAIFCYGNYGRDNMINEGFNPDKIHVIYNSLDYDIQLGIRNQLSISSIYKEHFNNEAPVLIFLGRLTQVKRLDLLLYAISKLKNKGYTYNLVLIGDGEERKLLIDLAKKLGIEDQIWFYGACYDETINAQMVYNSDLCVAPGNIGLTAMHVMMFGCPALTHNDFIWQMPEYEAIKPGITGDFFERNNVDSLAATIHKWIENQSANRNKVREYCFQEIDKFWNPHNQINILKSNI